jgi:hypothetical protein
VGPHARRRPSPGDDQAIIVVVDSATGEIRSCGDLSGYCIGQNPWKKPLASGQGAPVALAPAGKGAADAAAAPTAAAAAPASARTPAPTMTAR